jgi:hypothetical protein
MAQEGGSDGMDEDMWVPAGVAWACGAGWAAEGQVLSPAGVAMPWLGGWGRDLGEGN